MEKFGTFRELEYKRPDFGRISKELSVLSGKLRKARSFDDVKEIFTRAEAVLVEEYEAAEIASIRNTCDKSDEFYENEVRYINKKGSFMQLRMLGLIKALIKSPFRREFDAEYGDFLTKNDETLERIIEDYMRTGKPLTDFLKID